MASVPKLQHNGWLPVALLMLFSTAPLMFVGFPPLTDLMGHLGRYAIQTRIDQAPTLAATYDFEWKLIGNLGVDLLVEVLAPIFGLERAVTVIIIATQAIATGAVLWIANQLHGRITPYALFALPFLYGYPFQLGFANFSLSMALALLCFAAWMALHRHGHRIAATVLLALAGFGIWVCHTYGWAFLGLLCGSWSLARAWDERTTLLSVAARVLADCGLLLLVLAPMLAWRASSAGAITEDWTLASKLIWSVSALRSGTAWVDLASLAVPVTLLLVSFRERAIAKDPAMLIAAALSMAAFLTLPARVFGSYFADMRLVPYIFIVALLGLSAGQASVTARRMLMAAGLSFLVARTLVVGAELHGKWRQVDDALAALEVIPQDARVAVVAIESCGSWTPPALRHVGGFATARRDAFANNQWEDIGINLLSTSLPEAGRFARDPSQSVTREPCPGSDLPSVKASLAELPSAAFTHVWLVGQNLETLAPPGTSRVVWRDEASTVFEVTAR